MPLNGPLLTRVSFARTEATTKLANKPQCAALFAGYTAPFNSGSYILNSYATFRNGSGTSRCESGSPPAAAWTDISADPAQVNHPDYIVVCTPFGTLSASEGANTLIHEALHVAGHRERPPDATGKTTGEIQQMVREACGS